MGQDTQAIAPEKLAYGLQGEDVQAGKQNGKDDVGRREEHDEVRVFRARKDERSLDGDQSQEKVPLWERQQEVESHPCCRGRKKAMKFFELRMR